MGKQGIFSVESSCSCFSGPSARCHVQNDGTEGSNGFGSHVSNQISHCCTFSAKKFPEREVYMEKWGIFSVDSSCSCFSGPSACCVVQNDGTNRSNAFGSHVSHHISNGRAVLAKKWPEWEFSMGKRGIFSMESSRSCFGGPSASCHVQNDGTEGSSDF